MSFTAPQERPAAPSPQPEPETAPTAQEIKYRHDAAHYVASMLAELRQIAGKAGFDKLVTALDAAYYDAYAALDSHSKPVPDESREKVSHLAEQSGQ